MGNLKYFETLIDRRLLDLHTAFIGRVVSFDGENATVQPLGGIKAKGEAVKKRAVLTSIPVMNSARFKYVAKEITYVYSVSGGGGSSAIGSTKTETIVVPIPLAPGDLVVCICGERDISSTVRGQDTTPTPGHHCISDAIVAGVIS